MPPQVDEILSHLEEETSEKWENLEQELEDELGFDGEDVFVRMYAGDDEFNRQVPNDKLAVGGSILADRELFLYMREEVLTCFG